MTSIGDLKHRVRIEQRVKSRNTLGEVTYVWSLLLTVWAQSSPLRGRDFFAAAQLQSEITTRFRIRYRTGIDETMRLVWRGVNYDIKGPPIEVNGEREWIDLMCRAGVVDGR